MNELDLLRLALEIEDPAARRAFLQERCQNDAELRARVEALLTSHAEQSPLFAAPASSAESNDDLETARTTLRSDTDSPYDDSPATLAFQDETGGTPGPPIPLNYLTPSDKPGSMGRLAHYEIQQILGRGAFGIVLKAFDEKLQRVVAIKVLAPEIATASPARKRFLREARSSAAVRHDHVVNIYAVEEQPLPYLVMEYIPGQTLQQRLHETGPIDVKTVLRLGRQIAEGLAAAHERDLIHRDIKPGNILLEAGVTERVKITDFGLARAADDASMTQSGLIAGTPMYMAPEQALGRKLDQRADLFSMGSVLYQMLSGRPPFRASSTVAVLKRVAEETPRPISEIIPETPAWLCEIVAKLHEKDPDRRFQSAREVADVLADCLTRLQAGVSLHDLPGIPVSRPPERRTGRRWLIAAFALLSPVLAWGGLEYSGSTGWLLRPHSTPAPSPASAPGDSTATSVPDGDDAAVAPVPTTPAAFTNHLGMEFVRVPKGRSWLGGGDDRPGDVEVVIPADFYLGRYEVTQDQWETLMGDNPSWFSREGPGGEAVRKFALADRKRLPVERVTWEDCQRFVAALNQLEDDPHWVYRLPTETEWEYACRGGPTADRRESRFDYYFQRPTNRSDASARERANFDGAQKRTGPAGGFEPNRLGLCDMHGNVWEWCHSVESPLGGALLRTRRGGGWNDEAAGLRCLAASRWSDPIAEPPLDRDSSVGFRVARVRVASAPPKAPPPRAVVPFDADQARAHQQAWAKAFGVPVEHTNSLGMTFTLIPPGEFLMGAAQPEVDALLAGLRGDEVLSAGARSMLPRHRVTLTRPYYLCRHETRRKDYQTVIGAAPWEAAVSPEVQQRLAGLETSLLPATHVNWHEAQRFCAELSVKEGGKPFLWVAEGGRWTVVEGDGYRLPAEAEWEFACRAGLNSPYASPDGVAEIESMGYFGNNSGGRPHAVGELKPNAFGLYDMHGNVWEWTFDPWVEDGYRSATGDAAVNPLGAPTTNASRVVRSGSWGVGSGVCTSAFRYGALESDLRDDSTGFRVALTVEAVQRTLRNAPPKP